MDREKLFGKLKVIKPRLASEYGVKALFVFGSYARGDYTDNSDLAIIVDVDPSVGLRFVELADFLEESLGLKVDVVSKRAVKTSMWSFIERELISV